MAMTASAAHADASCYGGAALGYSSANTSASLDAVGFGSLVSVDNLGADGVSGGLTAGCDWHSGGWLIGGWGDYTWHSAEFEVSSPLIGGNLLEMSIENQWSLGGRAGYFVAPQTLVYGLIGFTRVETSDISSPALGGSLSTPDMDGIVYGGGIEVEIAPQIVLGAEYRYTDLRDENIGLVPGLIDLNLDSDIHTARAVLKYRYDFIR